MHVPVLSKNEPAQKFYEGYGGFTKNLMYEVCLDIIEALEYDE